MFATINHLDEGCTAKKRNASSPQQKWYKKLWPDRCTKQDVEMGLQTLLRYK